MNDPTGGLLADISKSAKEFWQAIIPPSCIGAWAVYREITRRREDRKKGEETEQQKREASLTAREREVRDDERKVSDYWKERAEDLEDRVETLEKLLRATRHEAVNARMMAHGLQHAGCQPRTPPTEFRELP